LEPDQLAGLPVESDDRVRVEVAAGPARAVREFGRPVERPWIRDGDEDAPGAVDCGRVPEAAAAVDLPVAEQLGAVLDRVELPLGPAAGGVERPDDPVPVTGVERVGVAGDGADQDGVVVDL